MDNCGREGNMAVGIFGGTFDPIHMGHLRVAEEIRGDFSLERIYFVPGGNPPHKKGHTMTGADERLSMVRAALKGNKFFRASGVEAKRSGPSYTIDTLKEFQKRFKELYFLIGVDAFSEIDTWHLYEELFYRTNFIVMTRPSGMKQTIPEMLPDDVKRDVKKINERTYRHASGRNIFLRDITQIDISSTKIKALLKKGQSIRYLVPALVEKIIMEKGLYGAYYGSV
jgi:nicotinate-nucleotide adenylyltransferase